jgi:hypothetical protein
MGKFEDYAIPIISKLPKSIIETNHYDSNYPPIWERLRRIAGDLIRIAPPQTNISS